MKKLGLLLALSIAFPLAALKDKDKHKDKSFEPVAMTATKAAGRYVGIDPDYIIELTAGGGTLHNFGRTATLTGVVFDGSEMRATAEYGNGRREPLEVTFVNRTANGERAFGLLARNINLRIGDDVTLQSLFCRRD